MLDRVRVILVGTSHPGNIGAAARAMKVMGLSDLILVSPRCEKDESSYAMASKGGDILDNIRVVDSLESALSDVNVAIGASARVRGMEWPLVAPREAAQLHRDCLLASSEHKVAWVLGREDTGLTNQELALCQYHVHIPTSEEYSSLNVAAALQVLSYESKLSSLDAKGAQSDEVLTATGDALEGLFTQLESLLINIGFHRQNDPKQMMIKIRRIYQKARLEMPEVAILRGILSGIERRLTTEDHDRKDTK